MVMKVHIFKRLLSKFLVKHVLHLFVKEIGAQPMKSCSEDSEDTSGDNGVVYFHYNVRLLVKNLMQKRSDEELYNPIGLNHILMMMIY